MRIPNRKIIDLELLFETFLDNIIENNHPKFKNYEKQEIDSILDKYETKKPHKKIYGIPFVLFNIDIPSENYMFRKSIYFDDLIAGHPLASHGWAQEAYYKYIKYVIIYFCIIIIFQLTLTYDHFLNHKYYIFEFYRYI